MRRTALVVVVIAAGDVFLVDTALGEIDVI